LLAVGRALVLSVVGIDGYDQNLKWPS